MLNKLNQADLQMEFTKASELNALSSIAPRFLTLLAVDISIESMLIFVHGNGISEAFVHQY